ncbi:MAG: hypothetical protein K2W96_04700 [Gemmataceae bacterium]|nr:hypothetical protein [Gemmataceae bacterium]
MPRYALLSHDWPTPHLDLLLEDGAACRTWRLPALPEPGASVAAERLADHRLFYLDHEGPVSGGRGRVRRVAAGMFDWVEDGERVVIDLDGLGRLVLEGGTASRG